MSERWKFQTKQGLIWGGLMSVITGLFQAWANDSWDEVLSWKMLVRLVIFIAMGIFVVGYFNWKEKAKKQV